jgi:hypothetical protein
MTDYACISAWALDFVRALRERPLLAKIVFRLVAGKYAYREFVGMMDAMQREIGTVYMDYGLEGSQFHRDRLPMRWWVERKPKELDAPDTALR